MKCIRKLARLRGGQRVEFGKIVEVARANDRRWWQRWVDRCDGGGGIGEAGRRLSQCSAGSRADGRPGRYAKSSRYPRSRGQQSLPAAATPTSTSQVQPWDRPKSSFQCICVRPPPSAPSHSFLHHPAPLPQSQPKTNGSCTLLTTISATPAPLASVCHYH